MPLAPLTATYRLQLNKEFTLQQATAIVPYLERLGISHLYCSPILKARPGSMHGYDVVDPTQVNPELGTIDDLNALSGALHERSMGMIVDIVPNHMSNGPTNPYWEDMLAHGPQSRYARWFDVDWDAGERKVVLPVLDDELDVLIERDELALDVTGKAPRLTYKSSSWPLDPATLPDELQLVHFDPTAVEDPSLFLHGEPGHRERLRRLLEAQHYRLTSWRRGPTEINYRRFFDINDLAALRQEDPDVFEETHAFALSLVADGVIDGLRVDHVDGLLDPAGYLTRLRSAVDARRSSDSEQPFPIFVEKILSPGETLRETWPVEGTTGYEFLNDLEDLFLDPAGYAAVERGYRRMRRLTSGDFADVAHDGKKKILTGSLRADVSRLSRLLEGVIAASGGPPIAAGELEAGIAQFIAALPVYRTYVDGREPTPHPDDVAAVEKAVEEARRRLGASPLMRIVELVADVIIGRKNTEYPLPPLAQRLPFITRLQQTSGPATAKGVEDTALYVYVPLLSRNEVGGAPDRCLDDAVGMFHRANAVRSKVWPVALTSTNTHDTKRSADMRARLDVITECSHDWQRHVARWRRLNRRHRSLVKGRLAPDTNTEYVVYQTLVGLWPTPRPERRADDIPDLAWRDAARERLERYMLKAVKEAKTRTSWTEPDTEYEAAIKHFIGAVLEPSEEAPFLLDLARFVSRIGPAGQWNALSRVLLHLTAPGTPDTYRGDELWFFALVDPDNRRPVDYAARERQLEHVMGGGAGHLPEGSVKLDVMRRVLNSRRAHPQLFTRGAYRPLELRGSRAAHVIAFLREHENQRALVIAPRLLLALGDGSGPGFDWDDTEIVLPTELGGLRVQSVITGGELSLPSTPLTLKISDVLAALPLALLLSS